jgi:hypothetical protein
LRINNENVTPQDRELAIFEKVGLGGNGSRVKNGSIKINNSSIEIVEDKVGSDCSNIRLDAVGSEVENEGTDKNDSDLFLGEQGDLELGSIQFSDSKLGESFKGGVQNYGEGNFVDMADLRDTVRTFENTLPGEAYSLGSMAMYANSNMNTLGSPMQGGISMHQSELWKSNGKSNGSRS